MKKLLFRLRRSLPFAVPFANRPKSPGPQNRELKSRRLKSRRLENSEQDNGEFEARKEEHLRIALSASSLSKQEGGLHRVRLTHNPLPERNFSSDISLACVSLGKACKTPFYISSMTGGWKGSGALNLRLARAAESRGWAMGIGSQRAQLKDTLKDQECRNVRKAAPRLSLFGNIGLSQALSSSAEDIQRLADVLGASAMILHLNSLQEAIQKEGTPQFKGGLKKIESLAAGLSVPLIVKETGCGFSPKTLQRLEGRGVAALDLSGLGGTHWGRIEGQRLSGEEKEIGETFAGWGVPLLDSLLAARSRSRDYEVWASGGLQTGLDAAKVLALGASRAGFARRLLPEALRGEEALIQAMRRTEKELAVSLFCTGSSNIQELREKEKWTIEKF